MQSAFFYCAGTLRFARLHLRYGHLLEGEWITEKIITILKTYISNHLPKLELMHYD